MRSDMQRVLVNVKLLILISTWSAAAMAGEVLRNVDPVTLRWWTWAFITAFSTIGWAISELDKLAEILFPEGMTPKQRAQAAFKFTQGYIASGFAGVGIYFIAKVAPGWINMQGDVPEMIILLLVTAAAYGGTRFLNWLLNKAGLSAVNP